MNKFGKFLLVITSLAPILFAYAVNAAQKGEHVAAYCFVVLGVGFSIICLLILHFCKIQIAIETLKIKNVASADKQTLAFLVVYLMPLFSGNAVDFQQHPWTSLYVVAIIGLVVFHSNAFTFNPLLALLGYHFYEVESEGGMPYLLITRQVLKQQSNALKVVEIANFVYMERD